MSEPRLRLIALSLAILLAGCGESRDPESPSSPTWEGSDAEEIVAGFVDALLERDASAASEFVCPGLGGLRLVEEDIRDLERDLREGFLEEDHPSPERDGPVLEEVRASGPATPGPYGKAGFQITDPAPDFHVPFTATGPEETVHGAVVVSLDRGPDGSPCVSTWGGALDLSSWALAPPPPAT